SARCAQTLFERGQATEQLVDRQERGTARQTHEQHLERCPRLPAAYHVVEALRKALVQADQVVRVGGFCELSHVTRFFVGQVEQCGGVLGHLRDHQIAKQRQQITRDVG